MSDDLLDKPRIYSSAEIEMFLQGERREVDRLLLHGLNTLAATLIPHAESGDGMVEMIEQLGGPEEIIQRSAFVKRMMAREDAKVAMMRKVSESTVAWALVAFLGFLATAAYRYVMDVVRAKLGGA